MSIAPYLFDFSRHDGLITSTFTPDFDADVQIINNYLSDSSLIEQIVRICPTKAIKTL